VGVANGLTAANATTAYSLSAPAPAPVGNSFFQLDLAFTPGSFTGGRSFTFGAAGDEFRSAFMPPTGQTRDRGNADLLSDGVLIPQGMVASGQAIISGTLEGGAAFSGQSKISLDRATRFLTASVSLVWKLP